MEYGLKGLQVVCLWVDGMYGKAGLDKKSGLGDAHRRI